METTMDDATIVAHLNDLLQLDHDAIAAYRLALRELDSVDLKLQLQDHLRDHERHIEELEQHIETLGGMTIPMPHLTGAFKLGVQAAVAAADDRAVLLAFKANEMQGRDKYARFAQHDYPFEVLATIRRAAADEERHYRWAVEALERMGASEEDGDVRFTKFFARMHGRTADAVETAERGMMVAAEKTRRAVRSNPVRTLATTGLAVVGAGAVLAAMARRR